MNKKVSTLVGIIIIVVWAIIALGGAFAYQFFIKNWTITSPFIKTQTNQTANWNFLSGDVVLKENNNDKTKTDVFVKNEKNGQETFLITLSDVYTDHYHPAEFHNGNLYIIRRTGGNTGYLTNPNWTDKLWKYWKANQQGVELFLNRGLDFRISNDENFIAIVGGEDNTAGEKLILIKTKNNISKKFDLSQLNLNRESLLIPIEWSGNDFWARGHIAAATSEIVKINAENSQIKTFNVLNLSINSREFSLNSVKEKIAFSTYPVILDINDAELFAQNGAKVNLIVYDLNSKAQQTIATSIAKSFEPKWINQNTLEFSNPIDNSRTKKTIFDQSLNINNIDYDFSFTSSDIKIYNGKNLIQEIEIGSNEMNSAKYDLKEYGNPIVSANDDVNFDGYKDLTIETGNGYMGVNFFYNFYLFDPQTKKFKEAPELIGVCNPQVQYDKNQILSECKNGPGYCGQIYKFDGKNYQIIKPEQKDTGACGN